MIDDRQEARRGDHLHFARPGRLAAAFGRADDAAAAARRRQGREQHAGDARQRAVERHLAERHIAAELVGRQRLHRRQQSQRDRQVEMAALLEHIGGGEVDGDPPRRQPEAQRGERRADPLARLGDRLVRQSDDGKGRQPGGDRHLGLDLDDLDPVKRDGPHLRDHTPTLLQAMVEYSAVKSTTPAWQTTPTGQTVPDRASVSPGAQFIQLMHLDVPSVLSRRRPGSTFPWAPAFAGVAGFGVSDGGYCRINRANDSEH